ncbi:MAG: hypothetical protein AAFN77_04455 [Planctomycetota bacterium]
MNRINHYSFLLTNYCKMAIEAKKYSPSPSIPDGWWTFLWRNDADSTWQDLYTCRHHVLQQSEQVKQKTTAGKLLRSIPIALVSPTWIFNPRVEGL